MRLSFKTKLKAAVASVFTVGLLAVSLPAMGVEAAKPVNIPNPVLKDAMHSELGIPRDKPLTNTDLQRLTKIEISSGDSNSFDLTGLEYATNLTRLTLQGFPIADLSPISNLTALTALDLANDSLTSLRPLSKLTNVKFLFVDHNNLSSLSGIENMSQLEMIRADSNRITDISALPKTKSLKSINLSENQIKDISVLKNIVKSASAIELADNQIEDISVFEGLSAGEEDKISIERNRVNDFSKLNFIGLKARKQKPNYIRKGGTAEDHFTVPFVRGTDGAPITEWKIFTGEKSKVTVNAANGQDGIEVVVTPRSGATNPTNEELPIIVVHDPKDSNVIAAIIHVTLTKDGEATPPEKPINPGQPGTEPGTQPGTDPVEPNPGTEPGTQPGTEPGTQPGTEPGTEPGTQPGTEPVEPNPAAEPGTQPGAEPGADQVKPGDKKGKPAAVKSTGKSVLARTGSSAPVVLLLASLLVVLGGSVVVLRRRA